ncbi:TIGR02679 family protein [Euzebya sp.]|uniref:TIGR02679 family protein n=1 Tax=Euzebya sp. TaxID=1971409 RepID=UPI003519C23A
MREERTDRLRQVLGGPALHRLRTRMRDHLSAGGAPDGTVTLGDPSDEERRAVAALLGTTPSRARRLRIPLDRIAEGLQGGGLADSVAEALEVLDGPIPDRAGQRAAHDSAWGAVVDAARAVDDRVAWLDGWAEATATSGRLRRASASDPAVARSLLEQLEAVLVRLPVRGGTRRARLANEALGAAHALDAGTPLAGLVLEAIRTAVGAPQLPGAEGVRESWAAMGVLLDDLTSRVCVLNLPAVGDGPVDRLLGATPGQPVWLTLRMLVADPPRFATGRWFACENLSVMAEAADELGRRCAPLVCVAGNPVVAVMRLLDLAVADGVHVAYHGDFDWPGVQIAGRVLDRLGASGSPWRLGATDYTDAVERRAGDLLSLGPATSSTPWDPALAEVMGYRGVAVEEEAVVDLLISDLDGRDGVRA